MKQPCGLTFSVILFSGFFLFSFPVYATDVPNAPDPTRMVKDIQALSHPDLLGRQTGTIGGFASAEYVANRFHQLGLTPSGNIPSYNHIFEPWYQIAPVTSSHIEAPAIFEIFSPTVSGEASTVTLQLGSQFLPVLDSPSIKGTTPIVFVGYGISDPARDWDEYEGLDVRNRVVMFLRGKPPSYPLHIQHIEKERIARDKGAVGFITLTGPVLSRYAARRGMGHQPLAFYTNAKDERPLSGAWISGEVGSEIFQAQGLSLKEIQETLNQKRIVQSRELQTLVNMQWESDKKTGKLINVLGMIPGSDPVLGQETVILGAHRDHFGEQAGLLFPGADDNASGTALLLELARILKKGDPPKRTILFASFSGEEQNLLGSSRYVDHPMRQLNKTVAMINVDHVGIGNGQLTVGVSKMPKDVAQLAAEKEGLSDKVKVYGFFPGGDHVPFAKAGIPTIAVVTAGKHLHFHQPSDTADTIQPEMLNTAARFVLGITQRLANPD